MTMPLGLMRECVSSNAAGRAPEPNSFLPAPEHERKRQQVDLVDEVVLEEEMNELARPLRDSAGPSSVLSLRTALTTSGPSALLLVQLRDSGRVGRDVLRDALKRFAMSDGIEVSTSAVRPVRGEDVVGRRPSSRSNGAENDSPIAAPISVAHMCPPAAVFESAGGILLRSAGRLHHAVQAHECPSNNLAHQVFLRLSRQASG